MKSWKVLLAAFTACILAVSVAVAAEKTFHAKLTGHDMVPSVKTKATGKAEFKLSPDGKEMTYKLMVKDLENPTAAHIHQGKKGQAGPPVASLFSGPKKAGKFSGVLGEGTITEADLMGDLQGKTMNDLVKLIKSGGAYVHVHTDAYPDGEIRGQVK